MSSSSNPDSLFKAIEAGDQPLCERLARENPQWLELKNYHGAPPLIAALDKSHAAIARALVEMGASLEGRDKPGYTALLCAAANCPELVEWMLERGADPRARSIHGHTFLTCAALSPQILPLAFNLLGPDSLEQPCQDGDTPLLVALSWGEEEAARALLSLGANARALNWQGVGAAALSARCDSTALLADLIDAGADPLLPSYQGADPLVAYAKNGNEEACRFLISLGAKGNGLCSNGHGALAHVLFKGKVKLAEAIALAGGCFDRPPEDTSSPLSSLKRRGNETWLDLLPHLERLAEAAEIERELRPASAKVERARL